MPTSFHKLLLCVVSALLIAAPFVFPGSLALAWVGFVPLFWTIERAARPNWAALFGWATGFFAHTFGFYWLVYTISVFGEFSYPISALLFLVYAALHAIQFSLLAFAVRRFGFGPLALFPALFWVALEFWFPSLFPWHLANSQSAFRSFIQTADLVGPYGASFIIMWANAAVYRLLASYERGARIRWAPAALAGLCVAASVGYGVRRIESVSELARGARTIPVAAVQGNIDVDLKWDPKRAKENLEVYRNLTRAAAADLVIWPETSVEQWVPESLTQLPETVMPELNPQVSHLIFGAKSFEGRPGSTEFKAFNTAFLVDRAGRVVDRYHKQVLLAFGEYIPFSRVLSKLPGMPFSGGFTPGEGPRTLDVSGGVRIGALICYEDLMPQLSRAFVRKANANVLVNLTNDAWYGRTVAPWQHARLAQWRAIETRRNLLRVTNTGVTALINATGEIESHLPIFTPAVLAARVQILEGETLYVRYGDWFPWLATLLAFGSVVRVSRNGRTDA
ncbi:MAG TPA: apolipoprotein N-acyltransferase [Candidatus Eisenbacteria bacterium]|nr:apolipoprotein N-acyltransferase [Candidatus Eisenbacteria bacterium]